MGSNKSKHRVAHNIEKNGMSFMGIENTGKSTFARQIAQTRGTYSDSTDNRSLLYSLFGCTDTLITTVEKLNLHWSTPTAQTAILKVRKCLQDRSWYSLNKIPQELVPCFIVIWTDSIVMQILRNAHLTPEFRLNADAYYYATHIQTLLSPGHVLTDNDRIVFRGYYSENDSQEMVISKNDQIQVVRTMDSGGGYRQRNRWRFMLLDTQTIVYFINLTHFYMHSYGDSNYLALSLREFEKLTESKWMEGIDIMFVLTHGDVLQEQLRVMTLQNVKDSEMMENYEPTDGMNVKTIAEYIVDLHVKTNKAACRQIGYLYADPWNYVPVITRYMGTDLFYRGINDPKQVSFETPFTLN